MPDQKNTGPGGRSGSLLSIGTGPDDSGDDQKDASLLSTAERNRNLAAQHRIARSRREARPNPLLHALAARPDRDETDAAAFDSEVAARLEADADIAEQIRRRTERRRHLAAEHYVDDDGYSLSGDRQHGEDQASQYGGPQPLIDPLKVVDGIKRSKRLIAATTIAGALIGVAIALATPKKYEAVGEILVDPRDIKLVDRELVSTNFAPSTAIAIVENQVRIMTSSRVATKVVDRLNLDNDSEFNGVSTSLGVPNVVGLLRSLLTRRDGASGPSRNHALAVQTLLENLEVSRDGKTFVVTVGVKSQSADKSALIANTVIDVFLENSGEFLSSAAGRAADELGSKLDQLRTGVENAERKVEAFKGENDLIDARGRLIGDDEIIKINDQLTNARARTIELSAKAASARTLNIDSAVGGALPEGITSPVITELRTQYADLQRQASQAAVKYGAKHPQARAIQSQLDGARVQLRDELRRIAASMQVEVKRAVELEQKLSARLAALKARQVVVSEDMVTLRELERDAAAKRAIYESYLLRARETGEQQGLNSANISVISPASAPLLPVGPSRSMISIAGTLAGFLLGIGLGGLRGATKGMLSGGSAAQQQPPSRSGKPLRPAPTAARPRRRQQPREPETSDRNGEDGRYEAGSLPNTAPAAAPPAHPTYGAPVYPANNPYPPAFGVAGPFAPPVYPAPVYAAPAYQPPLYPQPIYPYPMPPGSQPPAYGVGHEPAPPPAPPHAQPKPAERTTKRGQSPIEDICEELRDVRSAIYDIAERRNRRRA